MADGLNGKVALITGAARGQGRSHALRLARDGADIIAIDICGEVENAGYPMATREELAETERLVAELGRRISTHVADVRDRTALQEAVATGIAALGRIDIVVANAGISPVGEQHPPVTWLGTVAVNLGGTINTLEATLPHLQAGGAIVCVSSMAAFMPGFESKEAGFGAHSKKAVARLVHDLARSLAPRDIRVNAVHPGNIDTPMVHNDGLYRLFRPDVENPTFDDVEGVFATLHNMPVALLPPEQISEAVAYLVSDGARYVTGQQLKVEAGALLKSLPSGVPD
ncbi:oxidoreductase [Gordonia araii NBRC 100433]|uniref:Oxidoreductase n=1 Tax=Gordonia araii NBRC 100433 TaxID=1073574 RepID=G7GYM0_9ACTN|nr:mycofactocin-coupled SDR family oxidoreductase [Gordonia araii]NNG97445.1 mycofactocin-coupled SDR family oxidoreductase [Gordonia araii NBRC 100433]GAB08695.1 oxidoreductase [Gordonia araii NBRC 100433]